MASSRYESRRKFQVAYVGDDADDHSMDVEALGPALLSFGKLMRAANADLNKDQASVKVLVNSDFEHKCFNINFEVVQIAQAIRDLLETDGVKNATELLQKVGVIAGSAAGGIGTVIAYLKWKKGRKLKSAEQRGPIVVVKVQGDNNTVNVSADVFKMASNPEVLEAINGTLRPIRDHKEAKAIEFREDDVATTVLKRPDVDDIVASIAQAEMPILVLPDEEVAKRVTATLHTYGPVFDPKAPNWRFLYRRKPIYADIRETDIARDAVRRGGAFLNDRYKVRMEVTPPDSDEGTPHYKVLEVLDFTPAAQQMPLPLRKSRKKRR